MDEEKLIQEKSIYHLVGILERQNIQYNKQLVPLQFQGLKLNDQILKRKTDFRIEPPLEIKDVINKPEIEIQEGIFKGQWKNDKKNGRGQLLMKDGTFIQGYWRNDQFIYGQEYKIKDEQIYEGAFENGQYHGQGTLASTKSTYVGYFKNGLFDGEGELIINEKQKYKGSFKNGKKHGKGVYQDELGKYEGEYVDDKKSGKGTFYYPNQDRYEGNYQDDVFHGQGLYKYYNGDYYDGSYLNGIRYGFGLTRTKDRLFEGNLVNDLYDGKVKLTIGTKLYECLFKNGVEDQNRRERIE